MSTLVLLTLALIGQSTLAEPTDRALYQANDLATLKKHIEAGGNYLMMLSTYPHPKRSIPMVAIHTQSGLDVNARDDEGRTALHYTCSQPDDPSDEALWENRALYVASLLEVGANASITDQAGLSPLELAKKSLPYSQKLVELLQQTQQQR